MLNRSALAICFFCAIISLCPSLLVAAEKPNILWIIAEDMGPELSCYGTRGVQTPTLDDLASRGVRYQNAFTVTPVCSTSRSSFMTGMYAMTIDAHNHRSHRSGDNPLPEGVRVLTDWLRPAGYYTANLKTLTHIKYPAKFYKGTGKTDWNFNYDKPKKPFDTDNWNDLKAHQPFYAQINFSETHRGGAWNSSHQHIPQMADPEDIDLPPYYPDHSVSRAVWAQYLNTVMAVDEKVKFMLALLKRDGLDKNTIVVFFGDHGRAMPRGKQWPYDSGLHIPLIIYWPEGNDQLPEPKGYERGTVSEQLIASIDLSATTLDWAGVEKPKLMQGRILMGVHAEEPREIVFGGRDRGDETILHIRTARTDRFRYLKNGYPEKPFLEFNYYKETQYPIIGLMRYLHREGKLTGPPAVLMQPTRPAEELYDIQNDPWEINNLADDPAYAEIKQKLAAAVVEWQEEIDDQGRKPESEEVLKHAAMEEARDRKKLESRADDWFLKHPAKGLYKVQREQ